MKIQAAILLSILAINCRKNPHIARGEMEQLTGLKIATVIAQKKYQLDQSPSFEDIALFEADQKTRLAVFTPAEKGYTLLRQYAWPRIIADPKIFFISVGNRKSHILITHGAQEKTLNLFDAKTLAQEFSPQSASTANVKMTKNEEKPNDEILTLGKDSYRFNGISWIPFGNDEIFPYVDTFEVAGEQSLIEITNRGQFGTRVLITLAFPGVSAADIPGKLKLTKEIPTVNLYKPGFPAHKNGGGNIALAHPLIEIRKDSWGKNGRIKLPLFMNDIGKFTMRAVYSQRGQNLVWPAAAGVGIHKDGQGYFAVGEP